MIVRSILFIVKHADVIIFLLLMTTMSAQKYKVISIIRSYSRLQLFLVD